MRPLTPHQAAARCGVSHGTFCRWLNEGRIIGATKIGRSWDIARDFKIRLPYPRGVVRRAVEDTRGDAA